MKKIIFSFIPIIFILFMFVTNLFAGQFYDLVYRTEILKNGKLLFVRYRNPLLDAVLKTYEIYMFDPRTGKISFLQHPQEKLYILPVISRDRTTMSYHSLIEGNDYLVTANLETGRSIRLRFDTGGYFVELGIDYDNDTVAASIKRGENRQALYLISNARGTIRRILDGRTYVETGFLDNGNVYFVEQGEEGKNLGFVNVQTRKQFITAENVELVKKTANGDAILYSRQKDLYLYRPYGNESLLLSRKFSAERTLPLVSSDGSTCVIIEAGIIYLVNIPSGDVLYFISMDTRGLSFYITDFTFYIVKENKILYIEHKKPGGSLKELYETQRPIHLLGVSRNDRQLIYQHEDPNEVIVHDRRENKTYQKRFDFTIERIVPPDAEDSFYIVARSPKDGFQHPVRELYFYHFKAEKLLTVSTTKDTDLWLYLTEE